MENNQVKQPHAKNPLPITKSEASPEERWLHLLRCLDTPVANLRGNLLLFCSYSIDEKIGTEGAIMIAESLKVNTCLTTLNINCKRLQ